MKHYIIPPFRDQQEPHNISPYLLRAPMTTHRKLTGKQTRFLRSLGHHLKPVVMVGRDGLSDTLVEAVNLNLEAHELIKIRVQEGAPYPARLSAQMIADRTGSAVAQVIGKTVLLFRESSEEDRKIKLP